jgi:hypothetical protein
MTPAPIAAIPAHIGMLMVSFSLIENCRGPILAS